MRNRRMWLVLTSLLAVTAMVAAACGDDGDNGDAAGDTNGEAERVVLYSGRDEDLIGPIIERFTEETGIEVDVRYGNSAEMAAQLLEEGDGTPADVFYSQEVGALGALSRADLLSPLPDEVVERVGERYRPAEGTDWVGVTGRARVIVVNPELVDDMPTSITELTDEKYRGQVAWAPGNASFQSFVTAFRVAEGEEAAGEWLDGMIANDAQTFEKNGEMLEAVENGTIPMALINHYYWARLAPEVGGVENLTSELIFPEGDDPGALVNATAVGITTNGADNPAALALIEFLLSEEGQEYFVEVTWEYPLVTGIEDPEGVPALVDLGGPDIDLSDLDSLEATQELLTEKGLLS